MEDCIQFLSFSAICSLVMTFSMTSIAVNRLSTIANWSSKPRKFLLILFDTRNTPCLATTMATVVIVVAPIMAAIFVVSRAVYIRTDNTRLLHLCSIILVDNHPLKGTLFTVVSEILPLLTYLWVDRKTKKIYDHFKISHIHQTMQKRTALKVCCSFQQS